MNITEIFQLVPSKAARLFWTPGYVSLSKTVYDNYTRQGETYERDRLIKNCASRWNISRRCSEAILTGEATYTLSDDTVTIVRPVMEE